MFCIDFETFYDYAVSNSQMIRKNQIFAKEDLILKFFSGKEKKHTAESNDDLIERLLLENYNHTAMYIIPTMPVILYKTEPIWRSKTVLP